MRLYERAAVDSSVEPTPVSSPQKELSSNMNSPLLVSKNPVITNKFTANFSLIFAENVCRSSSNQPGYFRPGFFSHEQLEQDLPDEERSVGELDCGVQSDTSQEPQGQDGVLPGSDADDAAASDS